MSEIGRIIQLSSQPTAEGACTNVSSLGGVPFDVKRTYWTYDIPEGATRGGHAHKECLEVIIAAKGSFIVTLSNGYERQSYLLNRPDQGLLVSTGTWRTLEEFSEGSICLVLASDLYDANDYIYEYDDFERYIREQNGI